MQFEGYTGGGGKDVIDGLMSSGDVGHFDDAGRLFVDGRDDDMIVCGGENVFPQEVEDLLAGHERSKEAAVFGVDDEEFGQRLKAVVVGARALRGRGQEVRQGEPGRLQGPARRRVHRRAAAQRDRQGAQARAQRGRGKGREVARNCRYGQRTDIFDLERLGLSSGEGRRFELSVAAGSFDFGGQRYETVPELAPVRLDVSRTTGNGWALRVRFEAGLEGPCLRCLEPAAPHFQVDAREVSQPGAGDEELISPYVAEDGELDLQAWVHDALALALPGADHLPARLRRPVPAVRGEPQRRARPRARARARPAWSTSSPS